MTENLSGKVGLDTTDFKTGITSLNRNLRVLESGFQASAASLGSWGNNVDGLQMRMSTLTSKIEVQKQKVELLKNEYERLVASEGKESRAAELMLINLNNATAALGKMENELKTTASGLTELKNKTGDGANKIDSLKKSIESSSSEMKTWSDSAKGLRHKISELNGQITNQKSVIDELKKQYKAVVKEKGRFSTEAKTLKQNIDKEKDSLIVLGKELNTTKEKANKFSKVMGGLGGVLKTSGIALAGLTAAVAGAAAGMAKSVISSFGELEQNLGGSEAVFGYYAKTIQKHGENAYRNLGVSQSDYLATANKMGALFQGSGISQVESLGLTMRAMQRAADMASVMGIDMQIALDSVAGAAKGNFTMMDNLGVAMNATTVEAYALSKGLDFTWASASNAEKAEVAMQMFFKNTEQYAGNFAKESTQTVTGSLGLFQAAFGSFMAGLGNQDADVGNLTGNLVDAFESVVDNIVPVLGNIVSVLPTATSAILDAVVELLPMLLETVTDLFTQVLEMVVDLLPELIPVAVDAIMTIVNALIQNLPMLMSAGIQLLLALINGILPQLPLLITMALEMIVTLANGITEAIPQLLPVIAEIIPQVIIALVENLPLLIEAALQLIMALVDGLIIALPILIEYIPDIITAIFDALIVALPMIGDAAVEIVMALITGIGNMLPDIGTAAGEIITTLNQGILDLWDTILEVGENIVLGIWDGIVAKGGWLLEQVKGFFTNIINASKDTLDEDSPSKVYKEIGGNMAIGTGLGFLESFNTVTRQIEGALQAAIDIHSGSVPTLAGVGAAAGNQGGTVINLSVQAAVNNDMDIERLARKLVRTIERRRI